MVWWFRKPIAPPSWAPHGLALGQETLPSFFNIERWAFSSLPQYNSSNEASSNKLPYPESTATRHLTKCAKPPVQIAVLLPCACYVHMELPGIAVPRIYLLLFGGLVRAVPRIYLLLFGGLVR